MNTRRQLLHLLGGASFMPLPSLAQPAGKVWRIGYMTPRSRPDSLEDPIFGDFVHSLRDLGYVEGKNLVIEWRFADGDTGQFPGFVAEFLRLKVDVIVAGGAPATRAAQQATATLPIIMAGVGDPVGLGLVESLARPGKNTTGTSNLAGDVSNKLLELVRSMVPNLSRVATLRNPSTPFAALFLKQVQSAAKQAGISVSGYEASNVGEIDAAFTAMAPSRPGALIVSADFFFAGRTRQITALAAKHRIPSIYSGSTSVELGGLMSYGENRVAGVQRIAAYVDKVLKGAKPEDLPVEQASRLELVINRKTAKALGLSIPQSLLIMAAKVIE